MGSAAVLGILGAAAGLIFMGVIGAGGDWYTDSDPGWFGGQWWWVGIAAAAGVGVGLLRRLTRLPDHTPGLIADMQAGHVDPGLVPGIVAVSAVSLIGGRASARRRRSAPWAAARAHGDRSGGGSTRRTAA